MKERDRDLFVNAFVAAKPVWPEGREKEKNMTVGLRAVFELAEGQALEASIRLRIAASTLYRIFFNGVFVGHGPAIAPHGCYRSDEWDLTGHALHGANVLAIEVVGYNANSYYVLDQPSFVQAELEVGGVVAAATGGRGFEAGELSERIQKVERYSFQKPFIELYRLTPGVHDWRSEAGVSLRRVDCAVTEDRRTIGRGLPYPHFVKRSPLRTTSKGTVRHEPAETVKKDRALTDIGPLLGGYRESELASVPSVELQHYKNASTVPADNPYDAAQPIALGRHEFAIVDFGINDSGFIAATLRFKANTKLYFVFDEILQNGDIDFLRLTCVNIVGCEGEPGEYRFQSVEPYTLRYLKLLVLEGECEISDVHIREYANPDVDRARFACDDERLNRVFEAGRETFRQNSVDNFYDCPSRERAGWLCDSFFSARVAYDLSGNTVVERNFFENYLLPESFACLPEGMLPMCYPADHYDGVFIPNWALWFVIQLEDYAMRGGDMDMVEALRTRVLDLFAYFDAFKNEDGLLEGLKSWVFIEWSRANEFVQDVNYPSNMLFAGALSAAARLFGIAELAQEGESIRETIRRQSFNGEFFVDNAVRVDRQLKLSGETTEVCQYFAFFFGVANRETHGELWEKLASEFGPKRKQSGAYPHVHMANAFVGNYMRLELLSQYGYNGQIVAEMGDYFMYMAERTGTLWEHDGDYASCNHGFASYVVHFLVRDILGIHRIDTERKLVELRFGDLPLARCDGAVPIGDGLVELSWNRNGDTGTFDYRVQVPDGYTVSVL